MIKNRKQGDGKDADMHRCLRVAGVAGGLPQQTIKQHPTHGNTPAQHTGLQDIKFDVDWRDHSKLEGLLRTTYACIVLIQLEATKEVCMQVQVRT